MVKEVGPLVKLQKEADGIRKQVEKQVKDSTKTLSNAKLKSNEEKLKELYKGCYELKEKVEELHTAAEDLAEDQEPAKVKGYEFKKTHEINRLKKWQGQLDDAMSKLLPGEKGEEYLKEIKGEEVEEEEVEEEEDEEDEEEEAEEEEVEEEEDVDEEEEEDDEAETTLEKKVKGKSKKAEEEDDEDEDEDVEEEEEEDEDETEEKEVKTKGKAKKKAESEEEEDDDEEEEDDDEEEEEEDDENEEEKKDDEKLETTRTEEGLQFEAIYDYTGEEEGDLAFKQGDILTIVNTREDGWWEAENTKGERGVVPRTYLKLYGKYKDVQQDDGDEDEEKEDEEVEEEEDEEDEKGEKRKSARKRWKGIRRALEEHKKTSVTDVLHALGAGPPGFRVSTLGPKFQQGDTYTMSNYLAPKLSHSNLSYKDLFYDPAASKIRPCSTKMDRIITIQGCKQIPLPASGLQVLGRHIRMCLFDGQNILSNIHTVKVTSVDKEQKAWAFSNKIYDAMNPYCHSEVFLRSNNITNNIGILFELGVSYMREKTEEYGDFSCGWVHLPLTDITGNVINTRQFDLYVNGGTPYEKGVEVDPSISRRTSSNAFMQLISGNKQPRLLVKLSLPKVEQKNQMDLLPDLMIGNVALLPFYSYYRQVLADSLLRDRLDLDATELIHSPMLSTFPKAADQHDMMKLLRDAWIEKSKTIKRIEMRDQEFMKTLFNDVVKETIYPIMHSAELPPYKAGDMKMENERQEIFEKFKKTKIDRKGILGLLLSAEIEFTPFSIQEVSFDVIGSHCLDSPSQVSVKG